MSEKTESSGAFNYIVNRALHDPQFREGLANDPEETLKEAGYNLSTEEVNALKTMNYSSVQSLAAAFGVETGGIN